MTPPREADRSDDLEHRLVGLSPPGRSLLVVTPVAADDPDQRTTVVLSSGLGGAWFDWLPVIRLLPDDVRPVVVERPGAGDAPRWDAGTTRLDVAADDLVAAMDAVGASRAVVVGHSMGAWYAEACARRHPERVGGLVLLDGSVAPVPAPHRGRTRRRPAPLATAARTTVADRVGDAVGRTVGWARLGPLLVRAGHGRQATRSAGSDHRRHLQRTYARPGVWRAMLREWAAYASMRARLVALRAELRLPAVRVGVITAVSGPLPEGLARWRRMQTRQTEGLLGVDPQIRVTAEIVRPAPHMLMLTHPAWVARHITAAARASRTKQAATPRTTDERTT